jgi:hypothetical protein
MALLNLRGRSLYLLAQIICGLSFMMYGVSVSIDEHISIDFSPTYNEYSMMPVFLAESCCIQHSWTLSAIRLAFMLSQ